MNNDAFKKYIAPHVEMVIAHLGGVDRVREMCSSMPDQIVHFVAGGVFGRVCGSSGVPHWRDVDLSPYVSGVAAKIIGLNQEEIRRTLDFVRLRLDTGSATS